MNLFTVTTWRSHRQALGLAPKTDLFPVLQRAYGAPQRHYHTATHIADCLDQLQCHQTLAERPAEVGIALWFHDAVYHSQRSDNEVRSAAWAQRYLSQEGLDIDVCDRITQLILATRHPARPQTVDEQLIIDIDLSILGRSESAFERYAIAIRHEYAWVPEMVYRSKRRAFLQILLAQETIYHTPTFRALYEVSARHNLRQAIE
ncbi:MAG: N-methyl-D-aspartate receptor NMDAR2C subunit [Cyanobacteria bacterium P01_G01_bin.54]